MLRVAYTLLQGGGESHGDEEDDVASINSDRSALSFSSEVSINPYTKYSNPVQVCVCILHPSMGIMVLMYAPCLPALYNSPSFSPVQILYYAYV